MTILDLNSDYSILLGRILVLLQQLSYAKDGKKVLSIERIVVYDFFLRYPLLLAKTMRVLGKKVSISVMDSEINTVQTFYPTYSDLYKFKTIKGLIQILYNQGFIDIEKTDNGELLIRN